MGDTSMVKSMQTTKDSMTIMMMLINLRLVKSRRQSCEVLRVSRWASQITA